MREDRKAILDKAIFDDHGRKALEGYTLSICYNQSGSPYVRAYGKKRHFQAHRLIIGASDEQFVDHINGNTLDNRLTNLRICTLSQNSANQKLRKDSSVGLKGVTFHIRSKKYYAQIKYKGKKIYLGMYDTKEQAHEAYKQASIKYYGEFARY